MQLQSYRFFFNYKKKYYFLDLADYISNIYNTQWTKGCIFFLSIEKKFVLLQLQKLKKNEENIPTITQKKSQ